MSQDIFSDSQVFATQNGSQNIVDDNEDIVGSDDEDIGHNTSQLSPNGKQMNGRIQESLIRKDLTEDEMNKHKSIFVDIGVKTRDAEKSSDIVESVAILSKQLTRADQAFLSGGVNENMVLDSKCISKNTSITRQMVKQFQTNSKQFDSQEFAKKLLTKLNLMDGIDDNEDHNPRHGFDRSAWIEFSRKFCRFHRVLPTFHFINGSFDSTANEAPKQPKPRVRHPKPTLGAQTGATQIDPESNTTDDGTPEEVELIMDEIKKLEDKNKDVSSLPYLEVMVNPHSMSETVENLFHSSFLIKDGLARLMADGEGGPGIQSIDKSQIDVNEPQRGIQSVFSFTMRDWRFWIDKLEITKAVVRHKKKKTSNK